MNKTTDGSRSDGAQDEQLVFYQDLRKARRRRIHRKRRRIFGVIAAVVIALLLYANWDSFVPEEFTEQIQSFFVGSSENHFPVTLTSGDFQGASLMGTNLAVVTDTSFFLFSNTGSQLVWRQHGMNDPQISASGSRALLYDRGGKQFRVETRFDEPVSSSVSSPIVSGTMGGSGEFALATESSAYYGELIVYNAQGKAIFHWYDTSGRILSVALSPDGGSVAALAVGAKNGNFATTLSIFRLNSTKPMAQKTVNGTLLFSLQYNSANLLSAVGDDQTVFFDGTGKQSGAYAYGTRTLTCYANSGGGTALVFAKYQNGSSASELVPVAAGNQIYGGKKAVSIDGTAESVYDGENGITVLTENSVWLGGEDGSHFATISAAGAKSAALRLKGICYLFSTQTITRHSFAQK